MAKPEKSGSGLKHVLSVKGGESEYESVEVELRVPGFQNFGLGLAELERQAAELEKKHAPKMTPAEEAEAEAEVDALVKEMSESFRSTATGSKSEVEKMPDGPEKDTMNALMKMMEQVAASLESGPDEPDESDNQAAPADKSSPEDFEKLCVMLAEDMKWDAATEARVDEFLRDWPKARPEVLKAAHSYYKELYPELKDIFGDMASFNFTMPKPTKPAAIEDIFSINMLYVRDDGTIGLSGSCTWDEEHGFGAVVKNGKVVAFGHADEGFC